MKTSPPYLIESVPDKNQIYSPSEDTFLLLKAVQKEIRSDDLVLEVGTGSGYIVANMPVCRLVFATDINPHAVMHAKRSGVNIIRTDFVSGLRRIFSLIIFNPPYLPTKPGERCDDWLEYALDGGPDGRTALFHFCNHIPDVLINSGRVLILTSSLQQFSVCEELFKKTGFQYCIKDREKMDDGEELRIYLLTLRK